MTDSFDIHVFHFRCPHCGASPEPVLLRDYLKAWTESPPERLKRLLSSLAGALLEFTAEPAKHSTKKFRTACLRIVRKVETLSELQGLTVGSLVAAAGSRGQVIALASCPFCHTPAGLRPLDRYFTHWSQACRVQLGNLLYETGLVLWGLLAELPGWASGKMLAELNELRLLLRKAGNDGAFLECPQCGRLGNHLYGGLTAQQSGFCRWCLDMGGGLPLGFCVAWNEQGGLEVKMTRCDYSAPARNAWDILPPEIGRRIAKTQGADQRSREE